MRGVFTALVTPFTDKGELDLPAYRRIIKDQKAAGVTGVIPCGTTGESPTVTKDEKKLLIQTALEELAGSGVKVIAGTGSNSTAETIELSKWASNQGVDALLIVTPYYNKPSQAGLLAHYRAIADAVKTDIMLYNVPGRTGITFAAQTVVELAKHPRIRSLKEASGSLPFVSEIRSELGSVSLDILSGDDVIYLPMLAIGTKGVVSVASNLFPRAMVEIFKAYEKGDVTRAAEIHQRFYPLFRDLFIESNPGPVKYAMSYAGFGREDVRLPLVGLTAVSRERLEASLARCGFSRGNGTL